MLEKLMDSPIAWAILSILAVVSFIYAIICQHKNKEKKEFSYCLKSNSLIRGKKSKFEKLSITYDGQQINDFCVSKFTIWNSGNKTLNHTDMVDSKELTVFVTDECSVLDVELIACSEETNNFSVKIENEHAVKVIFEYADKKEGVVIQIIHTGTDEDIQIDCKIKGGNPIKNVVNETAPKLIGKIVNKDIYRKVCVISIGIMIVLLFVMSILNAISIFNPQLQAILLSPTMSPIESVQEAQTSAIIMSVIFFVYSVITGAMYIPLVKKYFNMGIPKKLKKYSDFETA